MRVLVVGGSGYVAGLTLPVLADRFDLRIFDRKLPADASWEYVEGDVTDSGALDEAAKGVDTILYMAMGVGAEASVLSPPAAYDVNVKGLHLALAAGVKAGIGRAVYTSSLSVYDGHLDITSGATDSEERLPEPGSVYGLTKRMGEEVCAYFSRKHGLPTIALRLFQPVSRERWHEHHSPDRVDCRTSGPDLARAFAAALESNQPGFEIVHITGDTSGHAYHHEKAGRLLGWQPREGI